MVPIFRRILPTSAPSGAEVDKGAELYEGTSAPLSTPAPSPLPPTLALAEVDEGITLPLLK